MGEVVVQPSLHLTVELQPHLPCFSFISLPKKLVPVLTIRLLNTWGGGGGVRTIAKLMINLCQNEINVVRIF